MATQTLYVTSQSGTGNSASYSGSLANLGSLTWAIQPSWSSSSYSGSFDITFEPFDTSGKKISAVRFNFSVARSASTLRSATFSLNIDTGDSELVGGSWSLSNTTSTQSRTWTVDETNYLAELTAMVSETLSLGQAVTMDWTNSGTLAFSHNATMSNVYMEVDYEDVEEVVRELELISLTVSANECEVGDMVTVIAEVGESIKDTDMAQEM